MAKRGLPVWLVAFMWFGHFCDAVKDSAASLSADLASIESSTIESTADLQSDSSVLPILAQPSILKPVEHLAFSNLSVVQPPSTVIGMEQPSYQWPAATLPPGDSLSNDTPVAVHESVVRLHYQVSPESGTLYHVPAATPIEVSDPLFQISAGEPLYHMPVASPVAVSSPLPHMPVATLVEASSPSLQIPAASPIAVSSPLFHMPAATPIAVSSPLFHMPAATPIAVSSPLYHMPAATPIAVSRPSIQVPAATPVPAATGKPVYQKPAPAPVGKPSVDSIMPMPDIVIAECGESLLRVAVDTIQLGNGQLVDPSDVMLGGCGPVWQDKSQWWMHFETELHGCGSTLMVTEDSLIYIFSLHYQPKSFPGTPIVRSNAATVTIQCHYPRQHNVSSNALNPTWIPYQASMAAEQLLQFTLRLMADDWQHERSSNVYFLGDLLNIEASVIQAYHVPLRIYIERCVAYLDPSLVPSYAFIDKDGCLMDSQQPGSRSSFLPRVQDNIIQLQMDVFRFAQDDRNMIYMYCNLKATAASNPHGGKACSFLPEAGQWFSLSGLDTCGCCDSTCGPTRKGRSLDDSVWEGKAFLGPITVQQAAASDLTSETWSGLTKARGPEGRGLSLTTTVTAGLIATVGVIVIMLAALLHRRQKSVMSSLDNKL